LKLTLLLFVIAGIAAYFGLHDTGTTTAEIQSNSIHAARVTRVIDGDTIDVNIQNINGTQRVRLIGVDTPELRGNARQRGEEAAAFTRNELLNRDVWLHFDSGIRDRYNRLLAYVWTARPQNENDEAEIRRNMFNARLLIENYARPMRIQPNVRYAEFFARLQREAGN